MLYRKKPLVVKSVQWFPGKNVEGVRRVAGVNNEHIVNRGIIVDRPERFVCNGLFGQVELMPGDWVVYHGNGGYEVVRASVFLTQYEKVTPWGETAHEHSRKLVAASQALAIVVALVLILAVAL